MRTRTASRGGGRRRAAGGNDRVIWAAGAEPACRDADPGLFFPVGHGSMTDEQVAAAKVLCRGCPVRQACLVLAVQHRESEGIWGGTTPGERRWLWEQAARLMEVGPLVAKVAAGEKVTVDIKERPAVVYHLSAGGWSLTRIAEALGLTPATVLAARTKAQAAAMFADAVAQGRPRRAA